MEESYNKTRKQSHDLSRWKIQLHNYKAITTDLRKGIIIIPNEPNIFHSSLNLSIHRYYPLERMNHSFGMLAYMLVWFFFFFLPWPFLIYLFNWVNCVKVGLIMKNLNFCVAYSLVIITCKKLLGMGAKIIFPITLTYSVNKGFSRVGETWFD